VLWEAFFYTKYCYSSKIKHFVPSNFWSGYATEPGGPKGWWFPQISSTGCCLVLREVVSQTKSCYSLKLKIFGSPKISGWLRHKCRWKQIFGSAKAFCPILSKLARKLVLQLLPIKFLPQTSWRPFFGVTCKKDLHLFFCKRWASFLPGFSGTLRRYLGFSRIFRDFAQILINQNFWECVCTLHPRLLHYWATLVLIKRDEPR